MNNLDCLRNNARQITATGTTTQFLSLGLTGLDLIICRDLGFNFRPMWELVGK